MVHITTQLTPMQLVFGCDTIMDLACDANCHLNKQHKQQLINHSNTKENSKQILHIYKANDLVLVKNEQSSKYNKDP